MHTWVDVFGLDCGMGSKKGKATVKQFHGTGSEGHFSIEVNFNGKKLETHQVGGGVLSRRGYPTETYIVNANVYSPGRKLAKSVEIEIPNAKYAMQKQIDLMKAGDLGNYRPASNSCLTHVVDVLEAGGETIGTGSKSLKSFANKYNFKLLF